MGIKFPFFRKRDAEENDQLEETEHIEGERAIPSVNKGLTLQTRATNFLLFGLVIGLGIFMLYKYYANLFTKRAEAEEAARIDTKSNMVSVLPPLNAPAPPPGPSVVPAVYTPTANGASPPPPPPPPDTTAGPAGPAGQRQPKPLSQAEMNFNRRLGAPVMFKVGNDRTAAAAGQGEGVAGAVGAPGSPTLGGAGAGSSGARSGGDGLGDSLQPTYTPGVRAELLPDRNFVLTEATHIECTMPEALDTTHPGMVSCVQAQDAFSDNGAVVLLEKGTVYTGQMKRALLNGQKRAFMVWTRGKTPNGVTVKLDSPATDELGRTGVTGEIDTHFWERFGNAIMVSLIDDVGAALVANQTKGDGNNNTTITLPNTVQGSQNIMSDVLKMAGDIPPTLRRHQAGIINIYVARDLDFRSVYGIREKR